MKSIEIKYQMSSEDNNTVRSNIVLLIEDAVYENLKAYGDADNPLEALRNKDVEQAVSTAHYFISSLAFLQGCPKVLNWYVFDNESNRFLCGWVNRSKENAHEGEGDNNDA